MDITLIIVLAATEHNEILWIFQWLKNHLVQVRPDHGPVSVNRERMLKLECRLSGLYYVIGIETAFVFEIEANFQKITSMLKTNLVLTNL